MYLFAGSSYAYPTVFEYTYEIEWLLIEDGGEYNYTLDLYSNGFDPVLDTLLTAEITMYIRDDSDSDAGYRVRKRYGSYVPNGWRSKGIEYSWVPGQEEFVEIFFDDVSSLEYEVGETFYTTPVNIEWVYDGKLNVTVKNTAGDFYFGGSKLFVTRENISTIPEPGTLFLISLGVFGISFKGFQKKFYRRSHK